METNMLKQYTDEYGDAWNALLVAHLNGNEEKYFFNAEDTMDATTTAIAHIMDSDSLLWAKGEIQLFHNGELLHYMNQKESD